jgi:hypothetical protein
MTVARPGVGQQKIIGLIFWYLYKTFIDTWQALGDPTLGQNSSGGMHMTRYGLIAALAGGMLASSAHGQDWTYLDDRSTPQKLVESYYYAISNQLYVQAYSYFQKDMAPKDFKSWSEGYADTKSVEVRFGPTEPDPGAGQIYWGLPVALKTTRTDGSTVIFSGCYTIHMANLGMQTEPPFHPMGIVEASLKETDVPFEKAAPQKC